MVTRPTLGGGGGGSDGESAATRRGRLLLVDAEPSLLERHAGALRESGYAVDTCLDGRLAADLARVTDYDVIVCEIALPGLDGVQLLRLVRERDLDVPVVLLTAQPVLATAMLAVELGALRYLVKPIALEELRAIVEHAAQLRRVGRIKRAALDRLGGPAAFAEDRAALEASFDEAVGSMWLAFQPIVRPRERGVYAYEALLRSREPSLPNPMAMFDAAARLGRLTEFGRVLRQRTAETAAALTLGGAKLFVNVHPHDLAEETLYDPGAPLSRMADQVVLEITERTSLASVGNVPARIARLRALGFGIAIDDLGAGYAGLSSFTQLNPEAVKIDMALVRDVHREPTKQRLIRSVIALCGDLGIDVVAEGVEPREERDQLHQLGCELYQGYLFARPGPAFPAIAW